MSSQTMTVTCVISLTRIRFLRGSRTFLIMSLTILSVCYCEFFLNQKNMTKNEWKWKKNKNFENSSKLGGVAWMYGRRSLLKKYNILIPIKLTENPIFLLYLLLLLYFLVIVCWTDWCQNMAFGRS